MSDSAVVRSSDGRTQTSGTVTVCLKALSAFSGENTAEKKSAALALLNADHGKAASGSEAYTADGGLIAVMSPEGTWTEFGGT